MTTATPNAAQITTVITEAIQFVARKHGYTVAQVLDFCELECHPIHKQVESLVLLGGGVIAELPNL